MTGRTVVLVEDNSALLSAVAEILRDHGFDVVPYADFESARRHLQQNAPTALVTDVRLGSFNGLHLVVLLKQWAPRAVAFVYSAFPDPLIQEEAERWGAGYATKDEIHSLLVPALLRAVGGSTSASDSAI